MRMFIVCYWLALVALCTVAVCTSRAKDLPPEIESCTTDTECEEAARKLCEEGHEEWCLENH